MHQKSSDTHTAIASNFCLIYSFYNAKNALLKKNLKRLPFSHSQLIQNEDDELLIPHLHT